MKNSESVAHAALARMNLREVAVAPHYTGLLADLRQMADCDPQVGQDHFMDVRRAELCAAYGYEGVPQSKPFAFASGVAVIPVSGSLINRFGQSYTFVTGYNFIRSQLNLAMQDADVQMVVLDCNSYGGEAAGCFELAADIAKARESKPILAVIDSNCYSACYAIASAASKIVATPSGGAGSIGVVAMHMDLSEWMSKMGVKVTFIHSGDHKVDGNPYNELSAEVRADIQKGVDASRKVFVDTVAANRNLDPSVVHGTEARIYRADEALSIGLIDAIATPAEAVQSYFVELNGSTAEKQKEKSMSATATPVTQAADTTAPAAQASADARTAERARIAGIQSCAEAEGRESLANHLALNTELSVDDAKAILAASPKTAAAAAAAAAPAPATPAASVNHFKTAMDAAGHPNVGADAAAGPSVGGDDRGESKHLSILRAQQMATGVKLV